MTLHQLRYTIDLNNSGHFFIQSEIKPNPILAPYHSFSRSLRQLHVITSSFDWFTVFSVSSVIGYNDYFGFGFTRQLKTALKHANTSMHMVDFRTAVYLYILKKDEWQ